MPLNVLGGVSDGFELEFAWGKTGLPFKESDEMLGILESHVFGDLFGYEGRVEQGILCEVDHSELNEFFGCFSGFGFYEISEIIRGETDLVGEILDRWNSFGRSDALFEVFVEKFSEPLHSRIVHRLTGYELAFIKSHAIVQKHVDVRHDKRLRELVDAVLQLVLNLAHIVLNYSAFFAG